MRKLLLALALLALPSGAWAQCTGVFPANTLCGNLSATAQPPRAFSSAGTIVGPGSSTLNGLPVWGNTSGTLLADGNGKSIPGNYTFLSNLTFTGVTAISGSSPTIVSGTTSFNGPFQISGSTKTFPSGAVTLGGLSTTQTWSGANTFTGATNLSSTTVISGTTFHGAPTRFGGQPWYDVKAGVHGCAPALGDLVTDDTAAIQCGINYISNTSTNGGLVFFPPGNYVTTSTITVPQKIMLIGSGVDSTIIGTNNDVTVLYFTGSYGGLRDIFINGQQNAAATRPAVVVISNTIQQSFSECNIWGGKWAMQIASDDFYVDNCYFNGWGSAGGMVWVNGGSGWFNRVKLDDVAFSHTYGLFIDTGHLAGGTQENSFINADFTGNFSTGSVVISSTGSYTQFVNATFSHQVILTAHNWTGISTSKFGSYLTTAANKTSIVASKGIAAITATNATCAANYGITC